MAFFDSPWPAFLYSPISPSDYPHIPSTPASSSSSSSLASFYALFAPSRSALSTPNTHQHTIIMNLRIVPAVPSAPTVIFSLNWHNLPSSLPLPSFYASQMAACHDATIQAPRNTLALDKAVGLHLLLDSVTFDLARGMVVIVWSDKRTQEWAIDSTRGLQAALEDVLDCVRSSGEEAEKEKKAAAAQAKQAQVQAALGHAHSASTSDAMISTPTTPAMGHKRHRTASGIFSSLVASFITPPSSPDPNAPAQLYRSRRSGSTSSSKSASSSTTTVPLIHRQNFMHPLNKRENFPANTVPQSRFLRRQARAKLVDIFRHYVTGRLVEEMRAAGIVGQELRERGILDDMDEDDEESRALPGTSGYAAAGGYVAYTARSLLRTALAETKSDETSSSSDDSLLLTPTRTNSDTSIEESKQHQPRPASPRRRAPTPSPQARQIRQLSSLLIGLTQKDKRSCSEEREMLELVKERSLRRRWSLSEAASRARMHVPSQMWTRPVIGSPLRNFEVAPIEEDEILVPFPSSSASANVTIISPPPVPRRTRSMPSAEAPQAEVAPKAAEAEDASAPTSRPRRSSLLTPPPTSQQPQQTATAEESDLIAIRSLPSLPSPRYTEFPEDVSDDVSDDDEMDEDSDEDGSMMMRVSPPPMYAPSLEEQQQQGGETYKGSGDVKGLDLQMAANVNSHWPHVSDGIYVA